MIVCGVEGSDKKSLYGGRGDVCVHVEIERVCVEREKGGGGVRERRQCVFASTTKRRDMEIY